MRATRKSGYPFGRLSTNGSTSGWRTSPRCSGSRGAFGRSRTSSARRHPSTVYHSLCPGARSSPPSFPGGLAKVTARGNHTARAAPPVPGARPSCLNCSFFRAHGAYFPVNTRTTFLCTSTPGSICHCAVTSRRLIRYPQTRPVPPSSMICCLAAGNHMTGRGLCSAMRLSVYERNYASPRCRLMSLIHLFRS